MLALKRRGAVWHIRGTIRVGREVREIQASTGCRERQAAESYRARLEAEVRDELLHGRAAAAKALTVEDVLLSYVERPGGLPRREAWYAGEIGDVIGELPARDVVRGWAKFTAERCQGLAPATVNRFRSTLVAALAHAEITVPKAIKPLRMRNERVVYLTKAEQEHLLASYAPHVRPIALVLALQGARTQECLQLQWRHVDLAKRTLFFDRTKSGKPRTVAMHPRVHEALAELRRARGEPDIGPVFLTHRGQPFADTRNYKYAGGNPLTFSHKAACRRAEITGFNVHAWRHHWASWCVMSGIDLMTIARLGGWSSLRMVERYAALSTEHMADAMAKLA